MRIGGDETLFRPVQKVIMDYMNSTESASVGRALVTRAVVRDVLAVHGVKNLRDVRSEDVHSLLAEIELYAMGVNTTYGVIPPAPPVEDDEDEPNPRKEKRRMQLTIIIPSTHAAVGKDGLLMEHHFDAGPVVVIVHSVLTHHEAGQQTIRTNKPFIEVRHKQDMYSFAADPLSVNEFSNKFAAALRDAEVHAMQVEKFIADQIAELVKAASIKANVEKAGGAQTLLVDVMGYLRNVADGTQRDYAGNAQELFERMRTYFG